MLCELRKVSFVGLGESPGGLSVFGPIDRLLYGVCHMPTLKALGTQQNARADPLNGRVVGVPVGLFTGLVNEVLEVRRLQVRLGRLGVGAPGFGSQAAASSDVRGALANLCCCAIHRPRPLSTTGYDPAYAVGER
jgi:hypothetical protein